MTLHTIISEYRNLFKELKNTIIDQKLYNISEQKTERIGDRETKHSRHPKIKRWNPVLLLPLAGLLAILTACSSSTSKPQSPPSPTVTVSTPLEEEITRYDKFTGRFRAVERVEVRARVNGYLEEIKFRDGQLVEKGDLLFVIDQRPYKIALEQARAELESAQTRLTLSEKELQRAKNLQSTGAVSQELIDRRTQEHLSARAAVNSARSSVRSAELDLEFTRIKAPVSGKISENFVSVGNLVSGGPSSATLLTRIVSFDPIYFTFEASEDKLIHYLKNGSFRGSISRSPGERHAVKASLLGEEGFAHKGELDFIDNEINRNTGTLMVRAVFPNERLMLMPGMFAKARFSATGRHRELLVPDKAIASDQSQRFVLVVDDSSHVNRKFVTTGGLHQKMRIIEEGLKKSDRVIIKGLGKVRPGQKVTVNRDKMALAEGQ